MPIEMFVCVYIASLVYVRMEELRTIDISDISTVFNVEMCTEMTHHVDDHRRRITSIYYKTH